MSPKKENKPNNRPWPTKDYGLNDRQQQYLIDFYHKTDGLAEEMDKCPTPDLIARRSLVVFVSYYISIGCFILRNRRQAVEAVIARYENKAKPQLEGFDENHLVMFEALYGSLVYISRQVEDFKISQKNIGNVYDNFLLNLTVLCFDDFVGLLNNKGAIQFILDYRGKQEVDLHDTPTSLADHVNIKFDQHHQRLLKQYQRDLKDNKDSLAEESLEPMIDYFNRFVDNIATVLKNVDAAVGFIFEYHQQQSITKSRFNQGQSEFLVRLYEEIKLGLESYLHEPDFPEHSPDFDKPDRPDSIYHVQREIIDIASQNYLDKIVYIMTHLSVAHNFIYQNCHEDEADDHGHHHH